MTRRLLRAALVVVVLAACGGGDDGGTSATFDLSVSPSQVDDVIPEQHVVLLAAVDDPVGGGPVRVSASVPDELEDLVDVTVQPEEVAPGSLAEITVVPHDVTTDNDGPTPMDMVTVPLPDGTVVSMPPPIGPGATIVLLEVTGERDGAQRTAWVPIQVSGGEDTLEADATRLRDRFVTWLQAERPDLGITGATEWTPTIVKPHILVVPHYLFLSDDWELHLTWHVMIAPDDWSRITLRPRGSLAATEAFEIPSVSDPAAVPRPIELPDELDR